MIRKDEEAANSYFQNCSFAQKRCPVDAFDYGDEQTVCLSLKRVGYNFNDDVDNSFGVYLGKHYDGYVVGIKKFTWNGFNACEVFDSITEMKRVWQLD